MRLTLRRVQLTKFIELSIGEFDYWCHDGDYPHGQGATTMVPAHTAPPKVCGCTRGIGTGEWRSIPYHLIWPLINKYYEQSNFRSIGKKACHVVSCLERLSLTSHLIPPMSTCATHARSQEIILARPRKCLLAQRTNCCEQI
jgi:hypothetical protein